MRHVQRISIAKAEVKAGGDEGEAIFFQFLFSIVAMMFAAAFGK
jgi:hypothetical protein